MKRNVLLRNTNQLKKLDNISGGYVIELLNACQGIMTVEGVLGLRNMA